MDLFVKLLLFIIALPLILAVLAFFLPLILILIVLAFFIPSIRSYTRVQTFQRKASKPCEGEGDVCDVECTVLDSTVVDENGESGKDIHTIEAKEQN